MKRQVIVIEIHQKPKHLNLLALRFLIKQKRVLVCPIKLSLLSDLKSTNNSVVLAPMAVNDEFVRFGTNRAYKENNRLNKILYLGNTSNVHQEECVRYVLKNIERIIDVPSLQSILIVGVSPDLISVNMTKVAGENGKLKVIGYVPHTRIPSLIEPGMIGILSYYDNEYFRNTFPIKAVEYGALKVPIIASDTIANREIFAPGSVSYFQMSEGGFELSEIILSAINDSLNFDNQVSIAYEWASKLTYRNRARDIMREVSRRAI